MKTFDEWWNENWTEQEYAGCKKCTEAAFKAGMLAAADIVWPAGSTLSSYDIYDDYGAGKEQAAKDIREAANE